jgi:hypothetical protein
LVFVQAPASAKFDGMPRSAVDAGLADVVAPAEELPGRIIEYLKHVPLIAPSDSSREIKAYSALENRIDGVVITFSNITAAKNLEAQLRQTRAGRKKRARKAGP